MTQELVQFNNEEMTLIQQLGYQNIPANHLAVFFARAKALGLNPQDQSQISLIPRKSKNGMTYTLQIGIGGARRTARRIAREEGVSYSESDWMYKGVDKSTGQETEWRDTWNVARMGYPEFARVVVTRDGEEFPHVVVWDESKQTYKDGTLMPMWEAKPVFMLGKNAAAGAYRKAFPDELGDMYLDSEAFVEEGTTLHHTAMRKDQPHAQKQRGLAAIQAAVAPAEPIVARGALGAKSTPEDAVAKALSAIAEATDGDKLDHIIEHAKKQGFDREALERLVQACVIRATDLGITGE